MTREEQLRNFWASTVFGADIETLTRGPSTITALEEPIRQRLRDSTGLDVAEVKLTPSESAEDALDVTVTVRAFKATLTVTAPMVEP